MFLFLPVLAYFLNIFVVVILGAPSDRVADTEYFFTLIVVIAAYTCSKLLDSKKSS